MRKAGAVLILLVAALPCAGAIVIVDDDGPADYRSIQAAINDANYGDIIVVFPGAYTGEGNTDIDFGGRAVTVRSVAPEDSYIVAATVIDCNASEAEPHRGFHFHSGEDAGSILDGLTVTGGWADAGGGILCDTNSSPTIRNCTITGNKADRGGGIYIHEGWPNIIACDLTFNHAQDGAALYWLDERHCSSVVCRVAYDACIEGCLFRRNIALGDGGAAYIAGGSEPPPVVRNCSFLGNRASRGGGIYGIYTDWEWAGTVSGCIFSGNRALYGGGVYGRMEVLSCTISGNHAEAAGGGVYGVRCASFTILWGNSVSTGAAPVGYKEGCGRDFNCIQDGDPDDDEVPQMWYTEDWPDQSLAKTGNIDDDPMFVRNPDDGGDGWGDDPNTPGVDEGANDDFGDLHLQSDSPCINAGPASYFVPAGAVDIDGQPRVMGFKLDIGVDEYAPVMVVTRPQAEDVWASGSFRRVEWSSWLCDGPVDIILTDDGGTGWWKIASGVPDSGSRVCEIPHAVHSERCRIVVVPAGGGAEVLSIKSGEFTVHPDAVGPPVASTWRTLGGDFRRAGLSAGEGPDVGCVKWRFETGGPVSTGAAVGAHDRVHVACEDGKLYTLDPNGSPVWIFDANSPLISSPTVGADGSVYFGSEAGVLYAVDVNGSLRWTRRTGGPVYSCPALSADGSVYVGSEHGQLYALGPDGSDLWSFATKGPAAFEDGAIFASPSIGIDGTVYIGGFGDPNLYALDPSDGAIKWVCNFERAIDPCDPDSEIVGGWAMAAPVVAQDGTIYQSLACDSRLYSIDPNNGAIVWAIDLDLRCDFFDWHISAYGRMPPAEQIEENCGETYEPGPHAFDRYRYPDAWSEPVLGPDGTIYVSFDDPFLRAVDPNGSLKWLTRLGVQGGFTLTVGSDGLIYAAADEGSLYVVNRNGLRVARFEGDDMLGFPVITGHGTIVVSDSNSAVWAIGAEGCEQNYFALHEPEDLDGDRVVDFADFALMAADWLQYTDTEWNWWAYRYVCDYEGEGVYLQGDIDSDMYVFFSDLIRLVGRWLGAEPAETGPESPLGPLRPPPGWLPPRGVLPPKSRTCFPAATPVWVDGALVPISEVAPGCSVGGRDPAAARLLEAAGTQVVADIQEHEGAFECRDILLENGNSVSVVDSHCFMLHSGQWAAAQDLRAGMILRSLHGLVPVASVTKRRTPFAGKVYNLKIENGDRYFVGEDGLVVRDF